MDRILTTGSYGICVFFFFFLHEFLKDARLKTKKLLDAFQKNPERYLAAIREGVWVPFVQIDSVDYIIKLDGCESPFDDNWEQKMEYGGFNINIRDSVWISDIGSFLNFNYEKYVGNEDISYRTVDGETIYSNFRYKVSSGKYTLSIKGYSRKNKLDFPNPNYGFSFSLFAVDEFDGYKNPREEAYDFNIANM
jgi:hypothetical protein